MISGPLYWNGRAFPSQNDRPVAIAREDFEACCCGGGVHLQDVLYLEYRWASPMQDLDTGTTFLGQVVGWSCWDTSPYMVWRGDNVLNGPEIIEVSVAAAWTAGLWSGSVQIQCAAGWYARAGGSGPAVLYVFYNGVIQTKTVSPGQQGGCATTYVGTITVYDNGTFDLV